MLLKSKSILSIEISPWGVNIIEGVRSARQPKLLNYIHIPDPPQSHELLAQKIAATLKQKGIKTKAAHLAFYHPEMKQHYLQIPNLSKKELQQVVKREVGKLKKNMSGEFFQDGQESDKKAYELYSDYQVLAEVGAQSAKKKGLLLAVAQKKLVDDYCHVLEKAELEPKLITSLSLAAVSAMALSLPVIKDSPTSKDTIGFLYLTPDKGLLTIISQGYWRFFREIPLSSTLKISQNAKNSVLSTDSIDYHKLILELSRSFIYFNQHERGNQVSSLTVSSTKNISEDIDKFFTDKLQMPVALFDPTERLNLESTPEPTSGWPQLLNSYAIPLGLLMDSSPQIALNLLPLKVREHKKHLASSVLISLVLITYSAATGAGYMGLHWAQENYRQAVGSQQKMVNQLRPAFEQCQKTGQERQQCDFHFSILKQFERASPLWRGVFYELSRLSPTGLVFSKMEIAEGEKYWELQAQGVINAGTSMQAQGTINSFLVRLNNSVFLSQPRVSEISIIPYKATGAEALMSDSDLLQSRLNFSLSCNILY